MYADDRLIYVYSVDLSWEISVTPCPMLFMLYFFSPSHHSFVDFIYQNSIKLKNPNTRIQEGLPHTKESVLNLAGAHLAILSISFLASRLRRRCWCFINLHVAGGSMDTFISLLFAL